jgi:cobalt/nickel transport system permease protein
MLKEIILFSNNNRGRFIHPAEKLVFVLTAVILTNFFETTIPFIINSIIFLALHVYFKTPINKVVKLLAEIIGFYLLSSIVFLIDKNTKDFFLVIMAKGFVNSMALTFLIFTTPMDDFLYFLSNVGFLKELADIAKTMERFILLLEDELNMMIVSATSRGGFDGFLNKVRSSAKIAALLLVNSLNRWKTIDEAITSRCFSGKIPYARKEFTLSYKRMVFILMFIVIEVILAIRF